MPRGINTQGDIIAVTANGVGTDQLWNDFNQTLQIINSAQDSLAGLLTFNTTNAADMVAQSYARDEFEEASEFGEPTGIRLGPDTLSVGYDFRDYDAAGRYTWRFLRDSTSQQIEAVHNQILAADDWLIYKKIMGALFAGTSKLNPEGFNVYGLYNGDGTVPPPYIDKTFDGTHTHLTASGATAIDSGDLEALIRQITEHGYGSGPGEGVLLIAHPDTYAPVGSKPVSAFRANVANNNGAVASYDFIPSSAAPAYLSSQAIIGDKPPAEFNGLKVSGGYGPALVIEHPLIPVGYVLAVATAGVGHVLNVVGFREHTNPSYRGLRLIPGPSQTYPLTGSFYSRSFGCGVRLRGAAAIMQIKANGDYVAPSL